LLRSITSTLRPARENRTGRQATEAGADHHHVITRHLTRDLEKEDLANEDLATQNLAA
jgi:hypothetical protein